MRIPGNWLSVQDLFSSSRSKTRKRRGSKYTPDVREKSQIQIEGLEQRLLLSSTNDPVFPDALGYTDPAVRAAILNVTTTGSQQPIFSLSGDFGSSSNTSGPLINIDDFRNDPRFAGIDGGGYSTVILDSGIDLDHPFFGPDADNNGVADRIVFSFDFADNDSNASDVDGHGSNVSSIVASSDSTFTGMAPGANIIHLKVFTNTGGGNFGFVEDALQWVITNASTYNIVSLNMSLGDGGNYSTPVSGGGIGDELAAIAALDIISVSASGNSYFGFGAQGAAYPAADPNSLSVGAVWDSNVGPVNWGDGARDITTGPGRITSFSQRSGTMTTIFAPGAFITGANQSGGTVTQGGTSQASPHISGIAVLAQDLAMQTLGRRLTVAEFTSVIRSSATTINDGDDENDNVPNTGLDFPLVDVFSLGEAILALAPAISITATDADKLEGSAGNTAFTFNVTRTGDLSISTTVDYVVTGSGTNPADAADFGGAFPAGTVSFAANEATKVISLNVFGDSVFEQDETFRVTLTNPVRGQLGTDQASGTIRNDDTEGDTISIAFANSIIVESAGLQATTATITRTGSTAEALLVGLANSDPSEISIPASVTIPVGESSVSFDVNAVDDAVADGTQTVTVTATASGMPTSTRTLGVRDNEVNPFVRLLPLGGLVAESLNTATLLDSSDAWEFDLFLDAGETLAVLATPVASEQLTVELVSLSGAQTSPANGQPAIIVPQLVATAGIYRLRVTGTGTTDFELKLLRNTATEQQVGEANPGAELAIDNSYLSIGRYAVLGESIPQVTGVSGFTKYSDAAAFVDISTTGTALNLSDDGKADITTTVGNDIFPAGAISVWNNGGIIASTVAELNFENTALPSANFPQALLPFWDDIDSDSGNVYWQQLQVNGIDTLIVQWHNRPHFNNTGSATFQLQLFASGPVRLRYAYRDVDFGDAAFDFGASATVGFQQSTTSAQQFSFNEAVLSNNDVLDYFIEPPVDIDEFTIDLTGKTGNTIDIVLAGQDGVDFSNQTLELLAPDGTTVLATAVSDPVQNGVAATGYDLAILNFAVPADGVYTLRVASVISGEYAIVTTDSIIFDAEPDAATDPLRSLNVTEQALGFIDASTDLDDNYTVDLTAGLTVTVSTTTVFDSASGSPLNSLNPELIIIDSNGATVATDADSATDGRNAVAVFAAPTTGTYRIQVRATAGTGEYIVSVNQSVVPALTVGIAATSVSESAGANATTVTISRTSDTTNPLTVDLVSSDTGEATVAATATIPAGQSSVTIDLAAVNDTILDGTQTVSITATAAGHDDGFDTVQVTDNETTVADLTVTTQGNEAGPIHIVYTVTLGQTNETGAPITFDFSDLGTGTAVSGSDYAAVAANAQISVASGASTGTLTINVTDDGLLESLETINGQLSNSSHAAVTIGVASATANIVDNETAVADLSVTTHGNEAGPVNILLTLTLDKPNNTAAEIIFDLDDLLSGTAASGLDYTAIATDAQLAIPIGGSSATLAIEVLNDGLLEAVETVVAQISNSTNAAVTAGIATVTANITDNDQATANLSVTMHGSETGPRSIVYTVTLDKPNNTGGNISFDFVDLGTGTATSGSDYVAIPANSTIVVADGASTGTFSIDIVDDNVLENLETVISQISNPSNSAVVIGVSSATADIVDDDATTLDIAVTTHGHETGPVDIVYTITLGRENRTNAPITFNLDDLGSGTAASGADYTSIPANTVLSIPVGETTATYTVSVIDDALIESLETVAVSIRNSSNTNVSFGVSTATANIVDNDSTSAELIVTTHGSEAGPVNVVFTVQLSNPNNTGVPITFDLDDAGTGTALSGIDYTAIAGNAQVTVAPGASTGSLTVSVINDTALEATETLTAQISNSSNTAVGIITPSATANIFDNDTAVANLAVSTQGHETGPVNLVYTVTLGRANNTGLPITFDFDDLGSGTATSGSDFTAIDANAQIVIADGATSGSIVVGVVNDALLESTETVIARILNSSNSAVTIDVSTAVGSITDDDLATASLATTTHGNEAGPVAVVYTVSLDKTNNTNSVITFDVADLATGTATSGADYTAIPANARISVPVGASSATLVVPVINDARLEATETLDVQISNSSNAAVAIGTAAATASITDNDTATATLLATTQGNENGLVSIVYTVNLNKANDTGVDITFDIADLATGTAAVGLDYTAIPANSQFVIAPGSSSATFSVAVLDDMLLESTETVDVRISNSSNSFVTISVAEATGNIMDDESTTANLSVTQHGSETGTVSVIYTVTLTEPNNTAAAITFEFDDLSTGTATAGADYTAIPANAQFSVAVGATTASFSIDVLEDNLLESVETILAGISGASHSGVNLGTVLATANIADNDSATASFAVLSSGGEVVNTNIVYEVTLSRQNDTGLDISFDLDDLLTGTAISGLDYSAVPSDAVVIVAIGAITGRYTLPLSDDTLLEATETVTTGISNPSNPNVSITVSEATGTIDDNETAVASLRVTTHGTEAGPVDIVYTVELDLPNDTDTDITFAFSDLANGTAISGVDYTAVAAGTVVTIPVGTSTGTVVIPVINDSLLESIEQVHAEISSSSSTKVSIGQASATANITSDDTATAGISVTTHGNEAGPVDIVYTVTLDKVNNTAAAITVALADAGTGSAISGVDYTSIPANTIVSIPVGSSTATYVVAVTDDRLLEGVETVVASISNSSNPAVAITTSSALATISSDETTLANLSVTTSGNEAGPRSIVYTVTLGLPNDSGSEITIDATDLATGSATRGLDYTGLDAGSVFRIPVGASSGTVAIAIVDDGLLESVETVVLGISNSSLAAVTIGTASATADVIDNETATANLSVTSQGSETGPVNITYTVTLDKPNNTGVPIVFDLSDVGLGTATSADDYSAIAANAQISIATGSTTGTFTVGVIDDLLLESAETVVVDISNPSHAAVAIGTGVAEASITSDDTATASLTVDSDGAESGPVDIVFTVTLDKVNNTAAAITFDLNDLGTGTAVSGVDFSAIATDALISIAAGSSSGTLTVGVIDDLLLESPEFLDVEISNSSNVDVSLTTALATATIIDDETAVADLAVMSHGNEEGPVDLVFSVTLDKPNHTDSPIVFDFADLNFGSATADLDYAAIPADAVFSIEVGSSVATYQVAVTDDGLLESLEFVVTEISNSSNAAVTIGNSIALAEISDNETAVADLSVTSHGDEAGPVDIVLTVTLSNTNNTGSAITFDLDDLLTGTAIADLDYSSIATDAQVVILDGDDSGSLTISVTDDGLLEIDEWLTLQISNSSFAAVSLGTATAIANIVSDERATADLSVTTHGSETGSIGIELTVTLDLQNNTGSPITLDVADLLSGSATSGSDYTAIAAGTQITIADGASTASLIVSVTDDTALESLETLAAEISNSSSPLVSLGTASAVANIADNDTATASLSVTTNGDENGLVSVVFTATLNKTNNTDSPITFDLADLATGSALPGLDYAAIAPGAQISIPVGANSGTLTVDILDDDLVEVTETVAAQLSNSSNSAVTVVSATATANIASDDLAGFTISQTGLNTLVSEGGSSDTFTFALNARPQSDVVFNIVSTDLSEVILSPATITFTPANWSVAQTVTVTGVDDTAPDGGQTTPVSISVDGASSDPLFASLGGQFVNVLTSDDEPGRLDVDANGTPNASTDGILIIRYLFAFTGDALIQDAIGTGAGNTTAQDIIAALMAAPEMLDVDGNGRADATTDGILIIRYLFAFRGDALIQNAIGAGAIRTTAQQVKDHLDGFLPGAGGGFGTSSGGFGTSSGGFSTGAVSGSGSGEKSAGASAGSTSDSVVELNIEVTQSDANELLVTWNNVPSADAYRLFIQPIDGNGFVRRIDTTDTATGNVVLPSGKYRMWVEAINLSTGIQVAYGEVSVQVADTSGNDVDQLTSLKFAVVERPSVQRTTSRPQQQQPEYFSTTDENDIQNYEAFEAGTGENRFQLSSSHREQHGYLNSDALMEMWMTEGVWID